MSRNRALSGWSVGGRFGLDIRSDIRPPFRARTAGLSDGQFGLNLRRDFFHRPANDVATKPDLLQQPCLIGKAESKQTKGIGNNKAKKAEHGNWPPVALQP